ncbi:uncharacterized protein F5147DRAFT_41077 [Suillus discolor]|uniref:MYND-type domain-containing protein n=1 Tax=Suillus discolor TaxID=1912936 RepID=A0A9P7JMD8_9AGAM|nr:uncharacterized protein F5147DRAFT_41077 [Suillus discolor]KAG2089331.1 hypothetical protein F5147DRAFT_41077 [Suillus discolor]
MSANTNNLSSTPQTIYIRHVVHPESGNAFRAVAASTKSLKASQKDFGVQCTQCQTKLEKPLKCAKCKGVWYCSKECQKKNWSTHKPACHEVERSSGVFKFIQMFGVNPLLMGLLKVGIIFDCGLFDNPRIGFDVPFMARVDIAMEPSDVLDFIRLYFNDKAVGDKLQGMLQVNGVTPWHPSTQSPLTPKRLQLWREARAKYNADGLTKDPVGLVEFISCSCAEDLGNSVTAELHIPAGILDIARQREPFIFVSAITDTKFSKPMNTVTCLEYINVHIRMDKQNQLRLRAEMTEQDKEAIRAAGRNENTFPACILKKKMEREHIYAGIMEMTRETVK